MAAVMNDPSSAAWNLSGTTIGDGWLVTERMPNPRYDPATPEQSGGTFSVGYKVERYGVQAFLKVFDIVYAFGPERDLLQELNKITNSYHHEKALLDLCTTGRMSRIIKIFDHGDISVPFPIPGAPNYTLKMHFIVFERADGGDIRDIFNTFATVTDALQLEYLHHVVVGLQQLHTATIAHQDLKPSNVVVFKENGVGAKIADFGRALKRGAHAAHAEYFFAGDPKYAPPEQLYEFKASEWRERREACDLFQFGSLVAFMFSGTNATAGILNAMPLGCAPNEWRGTYDDLLPIVQKAFATFLLSIRNSFPDWARDRLEAIVAQACEPDVYRRGHPRARAQVGKPLGLDRYVTEFSLLLAQARTNLKMRPIGK